MHKLSIYFIIVKLLFFILTKLDIIMILFVKLKIKSLHNRIIIVIIKYLFSLEKILCYKSIKIIPHLFLN